MKKILLATVSMTVLTGSAFAADLPSRKEVISTPVSAPLWQGFYTGLNAGYGFGTASNAQNYGWANANPEAIGNSEDQAAYAGANSYMGRNIDQSGFIGGGQVGYNYQYGQKFVLGFEADMQGSGISGQGNVNGWAPDGSVIGVLSNGTVQAGINWMGTARGRIGYLITPTVLAYVTGGFAYGGTYLKTFPNTIYTSTAYGGSASNYGISTQNAQQNFNVGWTAGAGAEWMMAPNWSIKGEALYYDLGSTSVSNTTYYADGQAASLNPLGGSTTRAYYQGVIARAGVNYHFNMGSISAPLATPVLAADLPSRKEALVGEVFTPLWHGFYAGLNAGYGFGTANNAQNYGWANPNYFNNSVYQVAFATSNSYMGRNIDQSGFIGGGQVGYNYQYGQSFVLGFETDMQGSAINGEGNASGWAPYAQTSYTTSYVSRMPIQAGINWMGTARGRVGYLITPTVIAYTTGGLGYGGTYLKTFPQQYITTTSGSGAAIGSYISTQNAQQNFNVGWIAGGGAEWMMAPNWSIKGEALYYDLGNTTVSNTAYFASGNAASSNPVGGSTTRAYYQGVIARAGVNYHFNIGSMPVVAKF